MRDFLILGFILLLPALAALGHDIYIAYNSDELNVPDGLYFSDLGWIWVNYSPATYDWARESIDPTLWSGVVDPFLQEAAVFVGSIPFLAFAAILLCMKILGIGPFEGRGLFAFGSKMSSKGDFSYGGNKKTKMKYKRK